MKITDVESIVLRLDTIDTTRADGTQDAFLVRVHTDEGIVGIGEADTSPYVARTIVDMPSSHAVARGLRELLQGHAVQLEEHAQAVEGAEPLWGDGGHAKRDPASLGERPRDVAADGQLLLPGLLSDRRAGPDHHPHGEGEAGQE